VASPLRAGLAGRAVTRYAFVTLAGAFCLWLAFVPARRAVSGVTMPYDMDHFREIAYAQTIADGRLYDDPFYRGTTIWYNPLFAATIALVSRITALDVPAALVQAGPFLSTAAQASFFVAAVRLIGPWPALIALVTLLFAPPYEFSWAAPAVTPWLFPATFAALFFYLGLLVCRAAIGRHTPIWWIGVGAMLGVVFLGHTAPALILGLVAVASVFTADSSQQLLSRRRFAALALVLGTALVVSAPFVYSIVVLYRLRIVDTQAFNWVASHLAVDRAGTLLQEAFVSPLGALRMIGAVVLIRRARNDRSAFVVVAWTAAAAALFGYGWLLQLVDFRGLPPLIPQHEFYFHLKAAGYMLAGAGGWVILTTVAAAVLRLAYARSGPAVRMLPSEVRSRYREAVAGALALLMVFVTIRATSAGFQGKRDFQEDRREAQLATAHFAETRLLERLRTETPPDAVVLATAEDSFYRVAPAGRAIVAVPSMQSNPYIPQGPRDADQKAMLTAVLSGDSATLHALADTYGVTHIVLGPGDTAALDTAGARTDGIRELSRRGGYALYERRAPHRRK
jgi:hypothetical protein